jgi:hypothetical protein
MDHDEAKEAYGTATRENTNAEEESGLRGKSADHERVPASVGAAQSAEFGARTTHL